jgi:predicted Fe-Mo cluster-binding NifX family protein
MKVAFATDDRKTISDHTGRAKEFVVYELSAFEIISTTYHVNEHTHHDHSGHSHKAIVDKIKDVDYLYVKHLGKHFKQDLDEAGIQYEFTEDSDIRSFLNDFFEEESP